MEADNQPMHKGQARTTLKELSHMGADVEAIMPQAPGLQGASGDVERFGGLTFGDTLDSQLPLLLKEVRTFESIPAWLATLVALWLVLDYGSHRDLLRQSLAFC